MSTRTKICRVLVEMALRRLVSIHRAITRQLPLPLRYWLTLSRFAERLVPGHDILVPRDIPVQDGYPLYGCLNHSACTLPLSLWTLDAATLRHLTMRLAERKPTTILEFGSGMSTLVLAAFCQSTTHTAPVPRPHVFSLEQSEPEVARLASALAVHGLSEYATVLHAPLVSRTIFQTPVQSYDVARSGLTEALSGRHPEFLVVDGPVGPPGTRLETLPSVLPYIDSHVFWLLDDALRPGELWVLQHWLKCGNVRAVRLLQIGKGVAEGVYIRGHSTAAQRAV
ncbi:MAG: hypothetical protein ACR2IK_00835 [Chloroflexota bacterium]